MGRYLGSIGDQNCCLRPSGPVLFHLHHQNSGPLGHFVHHLFVISTKIPARWAVLFDFLNNFNAFALGISPCFYHVCLAMTSKQRKTTV